MSELTKETIFTNQENVLALKSKFETIDFDTGELVNVLDSSTPVQNRLDAAKWLIDNITNQIELCKDRKQLWNGREDVFKSAIDTIRGTIKNDMRYDSLDKIMTQENTAYLTYKDVAEFDERAVLPEYKVYDITLKAIDYATYNQIVKFAENQKLQHTSKELINPDKLPIELISYTKSCILTIRKSPKSK